MNTYTNPSSFTGKGATLKCSDAPCTVDCGDEASCQDSNILGGNSSDLTVNCDVDACKSSNMDCGTGTCTFNCLDEASCQDSRMNGGTSTDVTVNCRGKASCKGNTVIGCGTGVCSVSCSQSDSCIAATVDVGNGA